MKTQPPFLKPSIWLWIGFALLIALSTFAYVYVAPLIIAFAFVAVGTFLVSSWRQEARRNEAIKRVEQHRKERLESHHAKTAA